MIKIENIEVFNFENAFRGLRNPMNSWNKSDSNFGIIETDCLHEYAYETACTYMEPEPDSEVCTEEEYQLYELKFEKIRNYLLENGGSNYFQGSEHFQTYVFLGNQDLSLAKRMVKAGTDESKFLRQIFVTMDITAPLYWWKEFDTYKVGTVANSTSTMHKLSTEPITKEKFSFDNEDFDNIYLSSQQDNNLKVNNLIDGLISELENLRQNFIETKDKRYWRALIQLLPSAWNQKRTVTLNYQVLRAMYNARKHHKLKEWRNFCSIIESLPYANFLITYTGE